MIQTIKTWLNALISVFFPDLCHVCNRTLTEGEAYICAHCLCKLPQTRYHTRLSNPVEERLRGRFPYRKITAFLHFEKEGIAQQIIHSIKYKGGETFGVWCGELMAEELLSSNFFEGIDLIVPVPLHKKKERKRGYNQAEAIARGVASKCNLPISTQILQKVRNNTSQTRKGRYERWLNNQDIFMVKQPELFVGKHILLIDDVITTGSTLESCSLCVLNCENTEISILSLAAAH